MCDSGSNLLCVSVINMHKDDLSCICMYAHLILNFYLEKPAPEQGDSACPVEVHDLKVNTSQECLLFLMLLSNFV